MTDLVTRWRRTGRILVLYGFSAAPGWMTATAVLMLAAAALSVSAPVGYRLIVDAFVRHDQSRMIVGVIVVAGLSAATWLLSAVSGSHSFGLNDRVNLYVSCRIATLVNGASGLEHFERVDYLKQLDLLNENSRMLGAAPRQSLAVAQVIVRAAVIVILLVTIYPPLAILPLFAIPAMLGDNRSVHLRERADEASAEDKRLAGELFTIASTAGPAKELRTFGARDELSRRHDQAATRVRSATVRAALRGAAWSTLGWLAYGIGFAGAILIVTVRAVHGQATPGEVVMAVSILRRAQTQLSQASDSIGQVITSARTAQRLIWLEDHVTTTTKESTSAVPDRLVEGITFEKVSFTYPGTETPVLTDINLHLPHGAVVAVVGDNGAGKTTLVKLLTGMYAPSAGRILIDGADLDHLDIHEWRAKVSAGFQDFVCFSLRAGETVGVGDLPRLDHAPAVRSALERAGATDVIDALPEGLDTSLGWSFKDGRDLSGGQWQKLALGRGMMRDEPLLLVLDEPTANLDAPTEAALFDRYADAAHRLDSSTGAITILVSHRFSTVRMADLIVVIKDGYLGETGDHDTLIANRGLYAELFELQARSYR